MGYFIYTLYLFSPITMEQIEILSPEAPSLLLSQPKSEARTVVDTHSELASIIQHELSQIPDYNPKDFDFPLPQSQFTGADHPVINLDTLIKPPDFNECATLARDPATGNNKRLDSKQLKNLRQQGEFTVPSQNFPGQDHKWRVTSLLQKGTHKIKESFYDDMAKGTHQIIISIPNRIYKGKYVTLKSSLKNLLYTFVDLPMLLIGLNKHHKKYTETQVTWKLEEFSNDKFVEEVILNKNLEVDSFLIESVNGIQLNLVLDKRDQIMSKLSTQYNAFKIMWENDKITRRNRLHHGLYDDMLTEDENIKHVIDEESKIHLHALFELIVKTLEKEDADALINLIKNMNIYKKHMKEYEEKKKLDLNIYIDNLKSHHNIRTRIPEWMENKKTDYLDQWLKTHPLDEVYNQISNELEGQEKYIFDFKRNINNSDEYKNKKHELAHEQIPGKVFVFKFRIWRPTNWKINESRGYYTADKYHEIKNSTTYPGWRLVNMVLRSAKYFCNNNFYLLVNLWQGKFGLRSFIGLKEYYTGVDIDHSNGSLKKVMKNSTWFGRIRDLWQNISNSRNAFETTPDTSILGKDFSRIFNVLWNYGVKGCIGTSLCFVGHPLLVLTNTLISGTAIITSPLWAPLLALLKYLFDVLVYDLDSPYKDKVALFPLLYTTLIKFLIKGFGQGLLATTAIVCHSLVSTLIYFWGFISNGSRYIYDSATYHLILKYRAKIPSEDGFLVKRLSGPGLSTQYFYLITHNLATVLLQYQLEKMEMDAFAVQMRHKINGPMKELLQFYEQFKKVALVPDSSKSPIKDFEMTRTQLNAKLNEIMKEHWSNYNIRNNVYYADKVKLSRHELLLTLEVGKDMCKQFVITKIYPRLSQVEIKTFWSSKNLTENDWNGLAKYSLCQQFNNSIIIPLEDVDSKGFHLTVQEVHVSEFMKDLFDGHPSDHLDTEIVNPETVDKLMNTISDDIMPESVFTSKDVDMMTITKQKIKEYSKHQV